jgi:hypothetical protein
MSYLLDYNPGTQQWGYPRRGADLSGTCIIHTAECAMDLDGDDTSAEVCARFIANRSDYGSYHRLVDSDSIIDMVPFEYEAWQDSETNPWGVGISAAVQAGRWLEIPAARRGRIYQNLAAAAAEFVNHMAGKGIEVPLRRITGAEARARVPGFCAHGDSGIARTDPGVQFDWALFFEYTRQAIGGISTQGTITPVQEDDMAADTPFTSKDGKRVTLQDLLNSIDTKVEDARNEATNAKVIAQVAANEATNAKVAAREAVASLALLATGAGADKATVAGIVDEIAARLGS